MSESYIDSVRPDLLERQQKVETAIGVLRRIVRNHAFFEDDEPNYMTLRTVTWDASAPGTEAYVSTHGHDGTDIKETDVQDKNTKEYSVLSADLNLQVDDADVLTAMTVTVQPPNVLGFDGAPLPNQQLEGAIADLERYEAALASAS